jgi:hypothetical protein
VTIKATKICHARASGHPVDSDAAARFQSALDHPLLRMMTVEADDESGVNGT